MMLPEAFHPPEPSAASLTRAAQLVQALETACDNGEANPPALKELRELTGRPEIDVDDFHEISGAMSYEESALLSFYPEPKKIPGLTYDHFVELCRLLNENMAKDCFDYWFRLFCINAKNQDAGDLLFNPPHDWIDRLKQNGQIEDGTTAMTFNPSAEQLAKEGWRDTSVAL